ncbi:lyase family protein [Alphaproteobacteria bacterium]|nr:lyase family protein [Alphaproteobacteria bacterium]
MTHVIDSEFYKHVYATDEMRDVFDPQKRLQRWLDIQAALTTVQARMGLVPQAEADKIVKCCDLGQLDFSPKSNDFGGSDQLLSSLMNAVKIECGNSAADHVNFGVCAQDIQDTATVLEIKDAYMIMLRDLLKIESILIPLIEKYKSQPMAGRTHKQHGPPITIGFKFAGFAAEIRREIERMKDMHKRIFCGSLHGVSGTMLEGGAKAYETYEALMDQLGLDVAPARLGSARDNIGEFQVITGMIAGSVGRIVNEIYELSGSELSELHEPLSRTYVGSSAMPHKRNAEVCAFAVAQCRIVQQNTALGLQSMTGEHERDARALNLDLHNLPETCVIMARALAATIQTLDGIDVFEKNITRNLDALDGMLFSEALMFHLAPKIGKQTAHDIILFACKEAHDTQTPIKNVLLAHPKILNVATEADFDGVMVYGKHIGKCVEQSDDVVRISREFSVNDHYFLQA